MANQGQLSMNESRFEELATALVALKLSGRFESHKHSLGPLDFELHTDEACTGLGLSIPFISKSDPEVIGKVFNVFVIYDPNGTLSEIQVFIRGSSAQYHEKAKQSSNKQIVIKDNERKMLKVFDLINQTSLLYITDITKLPPWERFSPIKEFLHLLALSKSCLMFHAGSVIPQTGSHKCVLFVGPGGSGKSSMTAYGISRGLQTHGDDYVLLDLRGDQPVCWAIYRTLKLHHSSPAELNTDKLDTWELDALTHKAVMLGKDQGRLGVFITSSAIAKIYGLCLRLKHTMNGQRMEQNPYLYSAMSTIQQMPFWVDASLKLIKELHEKIPYEPIIISEGKLGLKQALDLIESQANAC
jgi:hypothetical protein